MLKHIIFKYNKDKREISVHKTSHNYAILINPTINQTVNNEGAFLRKTMCGNILSITQNMADL